MATESDDKGPRRTDDDRERAALLKRLEQLEGELSTLRRELDDSADVREWELPSGAFQVLEIRVGEDLYGLPIEVVVEIIRYVHLTQIHDVPTGIVGALNLRGSLHAVLDARLRFGLRAGRPRIGTSIVIVDLGSHHIGLQVDRVLDVVTIEPGQLEPARGPLSSAVGVRALATLGSSVVQILDPEQLVRPGGMRRVKAALASMPAASVQPDDGVEK